MTFEEKYPHLTPEKIKRLWKNHENDFLLKKNWWAKTSRMTKQKNIQIILPVKRVGVKTGKKSKSK